VPRKKKEPTKVHEPELVEDLPEELEDAEPQDAPEDEATLASAAPKSLDIGTTELQSVSSSDPLKQYMLEVQRYPLLSAEEELKLANQLKETGSLAAAKALVSANLRLVVKIAFEYRSFYSNLLDLIQEGNVGLMKAVSKFDPTKGARLGYYASWWIRSYILKYMIDNFRLVKIGTTAAQKKLFYHLVREMDRLESQGLVAGPKLLAQNLNVREKDVIEMEQRLLHGGGEVPLDAPRAGSENKHTLMDTMADEHESIDMTLERDQLIKILHDSLEDFNKLLDPKEKRILADRLLSEEPKTLQEVADNYGLTRERARQIETKVIEKLRNFLKPALQPKGRRANSSGNKTKK